MLGRLLLLFVLVPAVELVLLIRIGRWIGLWPTLGIIVVTGVVGSVLARQQGFSVFARLQARLGGGELPGREIVDGAIILVSGALLLTPGVLTDVVGFAGLVPWTRAPIRGLLRRYLQKQARSGAANLRIFWSGPGRSGPGESGPSGGYPGGGGSGRDGSGGPGDGSSSGGGRVRSGEHGSGRADVGDAEEDVSYEIIDEGGTDERP